MTIIVRKLGGSVAVVIPKAVARQLDLHEGAALELSNGADAIVLRKQGRWPRSSLARIVAQMDLA